ncbi:hypothetical protein, partial [Pantoea agglomerans]|uniref:hypothetical protein n=1 Tax=Enterobacter agglomerans TaxID=549 RepID=UPI003C7BD8A2
VYFNSSMLMDESNDLFGSEFRKALLKELSGSPRIIWVKEEMALKEKEIIAKECGIEIVEMAETKKRRI